MAVHENPDKDHQMFPSGIANEGMQSSSPITQQQLNPYGFYLPPSLPQNVQLPARLALDPNGSDLPQGETSSNLILLISLISIYLILISYHMEELL